MFGSSGDGRARAAQRMAGDAWDHLVEAIDSASGAARTAGRRTQHLADETGSTVTAAAGEARRRAMAAMDALAGRHPRRRWEWIAGAAVAGLLVGWVAAAAARRAAGSRRKLGDDSPRGALDDPRRTRELATAETLDSSASPEY